jgi:hypothetical protein
MAKESKNLFSQLTQLFRSGPVVKRRVRDFRPSAKNTSAFELFRKTQSHVYSSAMSAYGSYDRMARYSDFQEMEYTPEIASALDIYAEESVAPDELGNVLHIYSENQQINRILHELFYDTLNVNFNLTAWVRNMCKYGDFFLFNDVSPDQGVINVYPIAVNEIEREEGFDKDDPLAVRFRWMTQGNQILENWQVSHFRILGNDAFLPYGTSVLEAARRIWRQLILIEDAMLVYRIVRAPDRRVFYIDVGNIPPEEIPNYMEQAQAQLKKNQVVDKSTGRVDLRYNPLSVDEDYFLPVRGSATGTKIDTLTGGNNTAAVEDVQYIQKKLFAALKIPKAYLGYDEGLGAKATLSQEDIRFSRSINRIQRTIISELNKIAIIHLHAHGFDGPDLLDFELKLTNPSTIAQQQKLELYNTKFTIAQSAVGVEGLVDKRWIRKNIFMMSDDEIRAIEKGLIKDKENSLKIEAVKLEEAPPDQQDIGAPSGGGPDTGGGGGGEESGGSPTDLGASLAALGEVDELDDADLEEQDMASKVINISKYPVRPNSNLSLKSSLLGEATANGPDYVARDKKNKKRRVSPNNQNVDHSRLVGHDKNKQTDSITHPFGAKNDLINPLKDPLSETDFDDFAEPSEYLREKNIFNDMRLSEIESVIKSLKRAPKISESDNTSGEDS